MIVKFNGILENFDFSKINHIIKTTDTDVIKLTLSEHLFNNREFLATIDNLKYNLNLLHEKKYSNLTFEDFLNMFVKIFSTTDKNIFNDENKLYKDWKELKLSKKDLDFFILSYILYNRKAERLKLF